MSYADYEHCPSCDGKALYMGDREAQEGVEVWHAECLKRFIAADVDGAVAAERERIRELIEWWAADYAKYPQDYSQAASIALTKVADLLKEPA